MTLKIGDTFWLDREGIGANTPLSQFCWDFGDYAVVEKIEDDKITLNIGEGRVKITASLSDILLMMDIES